MKKFTRGFTIIEIIVFISVMLILAAAAVSGSGNIIRGLKFNNTFNKMVFMVQDARRLALTTKDESLKYKVEFTPGSSGTAELFYGDGEKPSSTLSLVSRNKFEIFAEDSQNCTQAKIEFPKGAASANLICEGIDEPDVLSLRIGLCEGINCASSAQRSGRVKSFLIHSASGIPQVE